MKNTLISVAAVALLACSGAPKHVTPAAPEPATAAAEPAGPAVIADSQLGLSKTSVFDVPDPVAFAYEKGEPGETVLVPRPFYSAPPVIPHQVADFLPISIEENSCLACHEVGPAAEPGEPTAIPASHAIDWRNDPSPDKVGDTPVGARWRCVACHMPTSDATPLVGNSFPR